MFINPIAHFFDAIIPAYEKYVKLSNLEELEKSELQNSAIFVANLLAHYRDTLNEHISELGIQYIKEKDIAEACLDYELMVDICDISKHTKIDQTLTRKKRERHLISQSQIEETVLYSFFPIPGISNPREFYSIVQLRILVYPTKMNGGIRDLLEIATNVINFWSNFLSEKSLTTVRPNFIYKGNDIIPQELIHIIVNNTIATPNADGNVRFNYVARYYEPNDGSFYRWGFGENGTIIPVKISDDDPNARISCIIKSQDSKIV